MKVIVRIDPSAAPEGSPARRTLLAALKKAGFRPDPADAKPYLAALGHLTGTAQDHHGLTAIPGVLSADPDSPVRKL